MRILNKWRICKVSESLFVRIEEETAMIGEGKSVLRLRGFELRNVKVEMNSSADRMLSETEIRRSKDVLS